MKYKEFLHTIAKREGISSKQVEKEMRQALISAGLNCSPKDFIKNTAADVKKRLYIV